MSGEPDADIFDTAEATPRVYTIAEARLRTEESIEYLPLLGVDGYISKGWTHLLAGWWQLGKTEMMAAVILPWLRLGLRVLWITEEPDLVWADRADMFDEIYDPVRWENLTLVDALSAPPTALLELTASCEADVVIADTISEVCGIASLKDDDAVQKAVSPWIRRLRDGHRTLIFICQHRKAPGEHGERVLGSVILAAKMDAVLELEAVDGYERRRRLTTRRRRRATPALVYEMDEDDRIVVIPDARTRSRSEAEAAVLTIVNANDGPLTTSEVRRLMTPRPSSDTVLQVLTAIAKSGAILRDPPIVENVERRTVKWQRVDSAAGESAAASLLSIDRIRAAESVAADFAANTPSAPHSNGTAHKDARCPNCGAYGWLKPVPGGLRCKPCGVLSPTEALVTL